MKHPQVSPAGRLFRRPLAPGPCVPAAVIRTNENKPVPRGARNRAGIDVARAAQRLASVLALCLFTCTPAVATAQTIQYKSMVLTNSNPCDAGRCLLTKWVATVPPSQTLTYTVELSTDLLTWRESTAPITLTQSATLNVWVGVDNSVGYVRLRIVQ
jgi:hypothetical protein